MSKNPEQHPAPGKPGRRQFDVHGREVRGQVVGEGNSVVNNFHGPSRRLAAVSLAALLVLAGAVAAAVWANRHGSSAVAGNPEPTPAIAASATSAAGPAPASSTPPRAQTPISYDLTKLRSVVWNNGFGNIDPVRIGATSFPASIIGTYESGSSDPNDKAVWAIAGQCTAFDASVGKDTDSSGGGTGHFVVLGDDRELFSVDVGPNDPAADIHVDITGVIRLTLFDTRSRQDAHNAWGRPRVSCSTRPSPLR